MRRSLVGHPVSRPGGRPVLDWTTVQARVRMMARTLAGLDVRYVEQAFTGAGVLLIGLFAVEAAGARIHQAIEGFRLGLERAAIQTGNASSLAPTGSPPTTHTANLYATGQTIATIEIPAIDLVAVVSEGDDRRTLARSVGHVPGTAFPGETGNVGLAAHRDGFFSGLERIRHRDEIRLVTHDRIHRYSVTAVVVVEPGEVEVLKPTREPALTLVTCYPFDYLGAAPYRFIVRARKIDSIP